GDDPDHALVPALVGDDVPAVAPPRLGPGLDRGGRLAEDPLLDRLALAVQLLELVGDAARLVLVLGEQELERSGRSAEAAGGVDARREPEADGALVDGRWIDASRAHQRAQARPRRRREPAQAGERERAVLVDERDDVGDRRQRDEVELPREALLVAAEQRLGELVDDAGTAELRERVLRRPRRDDGAVRQRVAGAVVVGDDHVEPRGPRLAHLVDRRDPAVDGDDEAAALGRQARERLAGDAVALLEAARQVPVDLGAELAEGQDGERGRADAVDVVVAVDADPGAGGDRRTDPLARLAHVAEQERIVARRFAREERGRALGVAVAASDQDAGGRLGDAEDVRERRSLARVAGFERPRRLVHGRSTVRPAPDR